LIPLTLKKNLVKNEEVNRFYNLYIKTLKTAYESVGRHLESFLQKLTSQKYKKNLAFLLEVINYIII